jgi:hypothetical protein
MSDSGIIQVALFIIGLLVIIGLIFLEWRNHETSKKLPSILVSFLLVFIIVLIFIFLIEIPSCVMEKGIVIQPFEITGVNRQNISGVHLANIFCFELKHIETVRIGPEESSTSSTTSQIPRYGTLPPRTLNQRPTRVFYPSEDPFTLNVMSSFDSKSNFDACKVDMGSVSLSLGQMIPLLKELTQNQGSTISGSLQQYGSILRIVVVFHNPDLQGQDRAWEESRIIPLRNESAIDEAIQTMAENLSYKIKFSFLKDNANNCSQTWQAYKYLTLGWEACYLYNSTKNVEDLKMATRMALLAKSSEPSYKESDKLLAYLKSIWIRKGLAFGNLREYEAALQCYDKVIEIDNMISEINHRAESS